MTEQRTADATEPLLVVTIPTPEAPMPGWNVLMRAHWSLRSQWISLISWTIAARMGLLRHELRRRFPLQRAHLRVTDYYTGTARDDVNRHGPRKLCEDALVGCGVLIDDRPDVLTCEVCSVRVAHKRERRVVLEVWAVDAGEHAATGAEAGADGDRKAVEVRDA